MRPKEIIVTICVERDGDGFYAYAPALKGLHVGGDTEDEALTNAKDGIILYLESLSDHGEPIPEGKYLEIKNPTEPKAKQLFKLCLSQTMLGNKSKISRPRIIYAH